MKRVSHFGFILFFAFAYACGVKGPLQPPLILIPNNIQELSLSQHGAKINLRWVTYLVYESGVAMASFPVVEIWGLEWPLSPDSSELPSLEVRDFRKKSNLLAEIKLEEKEGASLPPSISQSWEYSFDSEKIGRVAFFFSFRVRDERGRKSSFSEPVVIVPFNISGPPQNIQAQLKEDRVVLRWHPGERSLLPGEKGASEGYNIYRKEANSNWLRLNSSPIQATEYEDFNILLGKVYQYTVRQVKIVDSILRESEEAPPLEVLTKDIFPPPPPAGVVAVIGESMVVISWEPSEALDLAGYRVWRRSDDEISYQLLTSEPILITSFEDRQVEKGKSYHYAITACDQAGNESQRTEIKIGVIKEVQ